MNALEKYELEDLEQSNVIATEESKQQWKIDSLESADWALRKIATLKASNEEIKMFGDQERQRINEWEEKETASNNDSIDFFNQKLSEYLSDLRQQDPKAKIKTPHGTVSTRKKPDSWEYSIEATEEIEKMGLSDFIKISKSIDKSSFKKAVSVLPDGRVISPDGEIIESVKVVSQGETVVIKEAK